MTDRALAQAQPALTATAPRRTAKADPVTYAQTRLFKEMDRGEKAVFMVKLVVFFCSMGYMFPRLLSDGCEGKEYEASRRQ